MSVVRSPSVISSTYRAMHTVRDPPVPPIRSKRSRPGDRLSARRFLRECIRATSMEQTTYGASICTTSSALHVLTIMRFCGKVLGRRYVRLLQLVQCYPISFMYLRQKHEEGVEACSHHGDLDAIRGSITLRPPAPCTALRSHNAAATTPPWGKVAKDTERWPDARSLLLHQRCFILLWYIPMYRGVSPEAWRAVPND